MKGGTLWHTYQEQLVKETLLLIKICMILINMIG